MGSPVSLGVGHGEKPVLGVRGPRHVGSLAGTVLRPRPPGAIPHAQAVNGDLLTVHGDGAVDPTELVEMMGGTEGRANRSERFRGHHPLEAQIGPEPVAVSETQLVDHGRLDDLDLHAGGQGDVGQIGGRGQLQGGIVGAVEHLPGQMSTVVPYPGPAGHSADVGPHHGVKPAAQPPAGMMEGKPRGFRLPPTIAHHIEMEPVISRREGVIGGGVCGGWGAIGGLVHRARVLSVAQVAGSTVQHHRHRPCGTGQA